MKSVLVVGGAGYIGSHMVLCLQQAGIHTVVLDDLSSGHKEVIAAITGCELVQGDLGDKALLRQLFQRYQFDAVMHFAAFIQVGESVEKPAMYYDNNVVKTLSLLDVMREFAIFNFIFSSTAAVYGEPQYSPIDVSHQKAPVNPYGRSKWMLEQILADYDVAYGLKSTCLRYFNAAGADPEGRTGESHDPETHLIPLILQAAAGKRESIAVFGRDYDTPDGTCLRDYVHVSDLCAAHLLALEKMMKTGQSARYNLGNGQGFSVQQVIDMAAQVTGKKIKVVDAPRRQGDPARLIADASLAEKELAWLPKFSDLPTIIEHAWQWELRDE
ncbi:UDP-glucose 4-epimerase [Piscirickettsia salmonis]|uniref:UDP-glucose 4-epimerase n=1 Tax=Piscirickettsia salmonis TaxID=1238 RepID=T1R2R0_PISSA|nr:UDP-glucose 4-epimerase GalE [Piscirickettsia salmonis]AGG17606.1 UDP-glucose-4-epimerase [Piscirickettsia salmonis LF-89 = ATCC VR-1361]AKP73572.2 UDP-glucose 4-epimerase [Piscirickettsia salmonis LF-89 = ATCC VR-1361]ALB22328.1 UDP-glucose 4-epimerase GalE [Piscirickettsia salmonis]ALY04205.1 UDP-glucose 4-epimerase [Piscirickettsia salmonis]AMA43762.1 UDP-glucose 4-epimerase [Piscirickettsia salmonis]